MEIIINNGGESVLFSDLSPMDVFQAEDNEFYMVTNEGEAIDVMTGDIHAFSRLEPVRKKRATLTIE